MDFIRLGIDLAKEKIQVYAEDAKGKQLSNESIRRKNLLSRIELFNARLVEVSMEACSTSNYWARVFESKGYIVKLIAPQYVKPFVKTNKNDKADAEAIATASRQPNMRYVSPKSLWQQDIQLVHKRREHLVRNKVALTNEVRSFLMEYGIYISQGERHIKGLLPVILEAEEKAQISSMVKRLLLKMLDEYKAIVDSIKELEGELKEISKNNDVCKRIEQIPGVGIISSTAIVAILGNNAKQFKNGREFSAYLGLTPKQHSSGGRQKLLGISKRGDSYIRKLLVQGARSVVINCEGKEDPISKWAFKKKQELNFNKASVAVANKNARIILSVIKHSTEFNNDYINSSYKQAA